MAHVFWKLSVPRCVLSVAFSPSHIACRVLHFPRCSCMLSIVCCKFSSGHLRHCFPLDLVCVPFLCWMSHGLHCMWFVACCLPECPLSHGVRCLSPVPRRISSRWLCCAASRRLPVADRTFPCRMFSLVRCPSHSCMLCAACCPLQSDTAPSHTQRIAATLAIERLGGRRGPLLFEVCLRACVRACV
jgi:hypothetical protein